MKNILTLHLFQIRESHRYKNDSAPWGSGEMHMAFKPTTFFLFKCCFDPTMTGLMHYNEKWEVGVDKRG